MLKTVPTFITFDIDGTLTQISCHAKGKQTTFVKAFQSLWGEIPKAEHLKSGFLELSTIENLMKKYGVKPNAENFKKLEKRYEFFSKKHFLNPPPVSPGIKKILAELRKMPQVTFGVATGNYEHSAWRKLEQTGLINFFPDKIGGFGLYHHKKEALLTALKQAEDLKHQKFERKIHVGDMNDDVKAAKEANFISVVVKTGKERGPFPGASMILPNLEVGHDQFMNLVQTGEILI